MENLDYQKSATRHIWFTTGHRWEKWTFAFKMRSGEYMWNLWATDRTDEPREQQQCVRPTVYRQFSESRFIYISSENALLTHLCRLLFIGVEGLNLHACTETERPLSGNSWFCLYESCFILNRQTDIGVCGVKFWKQTYFNSFRKVPKWNTACSIIWGIFFGVFWEH